MLLQIIKSQTPTLKIFAMAMLRMLEAKVISTLEARVAKLEIGLTRNPRLIDIIVDIKQ